MADSSKDRPPAYNAVRDKPEGASIYPPIDSVEDTSSIPSIVNTEYAQLREIPDNWKASDIESQLKLVRNNFDSLRKKLDQKEKWITESLENTISLSDPGSENLVKHRESLSKTKQTLKESMEDPELSSVLADSYAKITAQLDRIDKQINVRKYLIWNISACEKSIDNVCSVCEAQDILGVYRGKKETLWEKVQPGSERTQVIEPVGLAIEPQTDRIYIADTGNKRIQVFNSDGEHISHIPVKFCTHIIFICFIGRFLYLIGKYSRPSLIRTAHF